MWNDLDRDDEVPNGYRDADMELAELEAQGRAESRGLARMKRLRAAGRLPEAARACPHSWGHASPSPAAESLKDPRATEHGFRCYHWTDSRYSPLRQH